jgi:hypothetical protein
MSRHHGGPSWVMPAEIARATAFYYGPTRAVRLLFPRDASSHRIGAPAGIKFDRARPVLMADPALEVSVIEMTAAGKGAGSATRIY